MSSDKMVKKSISLPQELVERIKKYSQREKRSFSAQIALWAERALEEVEKEVNVKSPVSKIS